MCRNQNLDAIVRPRTHATIQSSNPISPVFKKKANVNAPLDVPPPEPILKRSGNMPKSVSSHQESFLLSQYGFGLRSPSQKENTDALCFDEADIGAAAVERDIDSIRVRAPDARVPDLPESLPDFEPLGPTERGELEGRSGGTAFQSVRLLDSLGLGTSVNDGINPGDDIPAEELYLRDRKSVV